MSLLLQVNLHEETIWLNASFATVPLGNPICCHSLGFGFHSGSLLLMSKGPVSCFMFNLFSRPVFSLSFTLPLYRYKYSRLSLSQ